jgi:uncharacterized protein YjbI with pentapeptide repeats
MRIQIKSRFDDRILYECAAESMLVALQQAVKTGANLYGANLDGANLTRANLYGANLDGANLTRANLDGANLYGANLYGANLYGANLTRANLYGANLDGANLTRANLYGANLDGANLTRANLYGKEIVSVVQFGGIGSERRSSTAIVLVDGSVDVRCGCFCGSLGEFAAQIERTHANNSRCLAEYRAAVEFVQKCAEAALDAMPKAEKSA